MLNETASSRENRPVVRPPQAPLTRDEILHNDIRSAVGTVLLIETEAFLPADESAEMDYQVVGGLGSRIVATFEGSLLLDSEEAYDKLDQLLAPTNHLAVFRMAKSDNPAIQHTVHVITGRLNPKPRPWWPNLLLFIATLFSVLLVGMDLAINQIANENLPLARELASRGFLELFRGLPYALSILLILGAHELGHYFAARRHKLAVTLPYFIPVPFISLFGTMGAFIQLRQPMRNRKMLLDVGAAGPLAGLIFAVPILLIGLSQTRLIDMGGGGFYEGDSIFYATAKIITFGKFYPDGEKDVCINCDQMAWAGWTGLLVTALNLIPIGQLDGGHVLYALIGERARRLYYPLLGVMVALVFVADTWFIWVLLLLFFGRVYATPLDMITPLDNRRKWVAIISMIAFVLIFIPAPLATQSPTAPVLPDPSNNASLLVAPLLVVQWLRHKFR